MVRHLDKVTQSPIKESVCLQGAGVKRVAEKVKAVHDRSSSSSSSGRTSTAVFCLSVGTNQIQKRRSEEFVNNYKDMLDNIRSRGGAAVVHSILPRVGVSHEWQSRALGINSRLEKKYKGFRYDIHRQLGPSLWEEILVCE